MGFRGLIKFRSLVGFFLKKFLLQVLQKSSFNTRQRYYAVVQSSQRGFQSQNFLKQMILEAAHGDSTLKLTSRLSVFPAER